MYLFKVKINRSHSSNFHEHISLDPDSHLRWKIDRWAITSKWPINLVFLNGFLILQIWVLEIMASIHLQLKKSSGDLFYSSLEVLLFIFRIVPFVYVKDRIKLIISHPYCLMLRTFLDESYLTISNETHRKETFWKL